MDGSFTRSVCTFLVTAIAGDDSDSHSINNLQAQVFFSPRGGCTEAIVNAISQAKTEILVQAYSFTSSPIAKALVSAHKRGVHITIVLDRSQRKRSTVQLTSQAHASIATYIDAVHAIAHDKVMRPWHDFTTSPLFKRVIRTTYIVSIWHHSPFHQPPLSFRE